MTQEEQLQNNTLIAEFMDETGEFNHKRHRAGTIESLRFHDDWGWLMPVVEKIGIPPLNSFTIEAKDNDSGLTEHGCIISKPNAFIEAYSTESLIDAVYRAVVEFIRQYNEQQEGAR